MKFEEGIIKTPEFLVDENCGGFGKVLFDSFRKYSERVALISGKTDDFTTYKDLLVKCVSTAVELRNRGFQSQDLVGFCADRDNLNALVPLIAGQFLGCVTFSIDPAISIEGCSELIEQVQPKIIFVIEDAKEKIAETFRRCKVTSSEIITFGKEFESLFLRHAEPVVKEFQPILVRDLKETCLIHFSSGSTGPPKPICLNHYYALKFGSCAAFDLKITSPRREFGHHPVANVSLRYLNWYSAAGTYEFADMFCNGGCILLKEQFDVSDLWNSFNKYHITDLVLSPLQCIEMCKSQEISRRDFSSLHEIATGSYVIHEDYILALRRLFPGIPIKQTYGLTELGITTTFSILDPEHQRLLNTRPGSCGLPVSGLLYKVVSLETGKKCKANELGELCLKGKQVFSKFYNRSASGSFDEEGFFRTGDLVYFDDDFCFYFLDRIKSILRYKGRSIYPQHIEGVILSHPSVKDAVVIGVPHSTDGERLLAVVALKKDAPNVTEQELQEYVNKRVEDHNRLREGVVFMDNIPKTINGKVQRLQTRELALNAKQRPNTNAKV